MLLCGRPLLPTVARRRNIGCALFQEKTPLFKGDDLQRPYKERREPDEVFTNLTWSLHERLLRELAFRLHIRRLNF
jgi:hypothetical protein